MTIKKTITVDWVRYGNPKEYLLKSIHHFRKIMCSNQWTLKRKVYKFNRRGDLYHE